MNVPHPTDRFPPALMLEAAKKELARREARFGILSNALFAEGGYNILLFLFVEEAEGRFCRIDDLVRASQLPMKIAMRWLTALRDDELVNHCCDPKDIGRSGFELSFEGCHAVRAMLCEMMDVERKLTESTLLPKLKEAFAVSLGCILLGGFLVPALI